MFEYLDVSILESRYKIQNIPNTNVNVQIILRSKNDTHGRPWRERCQNMGTAHPAAARIHAAALVMRPGSSSTITVPRTPPRSVARECCRSSASTK